MKALRINIILPFPVTKPVGGPKIMYEYANRLSERGHQVAVFHSLKRPFKKSATPLWYKQFIYVLRGVARPKWFELKKQISSVIVPEITDKYIPDADITLSTWWQMTYAIDKLSVSKGKKFNLIQDYENWGGEDEKVDNSFRLPVNHLVIAKYLQKLVEEKSGTVPEHIPNAIDSTKFFQKVMPKDRLPFSMIMMFSEEPRKGTVYGMECIQLLLGKFPLLKVVLFGVYPRPKDLPSRISYYQRPANLPQLYNEAAIFFSPSLGEGWALPPAEAMACGCAVVCTDIGGHLDYANNNETALLVQPKNINDMEEKIRVLLEDNELRIKIAANAQRLISTEFNWETSVQKMETSFYKALKK